MPQNSDEDIEFNIVATKKREKRREKNRRTLIDSEIILSSDFESGNGIDFKKYDTDIYGFTPIRDPGTLYSGQAFYFKFSAENRHIRKDGIKNITVTAIADYDEVWKGWNSALRSKLWKYSQDGILSHIESRKIKATQYSIGINLRLLPQEKIFISNMLVFSYNEMRSIIEDIQTIYPNFVKLSEIGKSCLGNPILSLKINPEDSHWNDPHKKKIIVSGTPQSNEFGDYGAIMVLRKFLEKGPSYWDNFHKNFQLEFIFFQNPDGIIEGRNMVNSKGDNVFFGFTEKLEEMSEESRIVWEYITRDVPYYYLEYHSFFQASKTIRPYVYPVEFLKDTTKQKVYNKLSKELIAYSNGAKQKIEPEQNWFKDTLAYRLQKKYECLTIQYKLHSSMEIKENEKAAWFVFEKSIKIIEKYILKNNK